MPVSFFKSFFTIAALLSTPGVAQTIGNWDINYLSLETNFDSGSNNEIIVKYEIGKDRDFSVEIFDKGCVDPITGITINVTPVRTALNDDHDLFDVMLDLDKNNIHGSNIWNAFSSKIELCVRVQLKTGDTVVREDPRDIDVGFDFQVDFQAQDATLGSASMTSGSGSTTVASYVEACKCDGLVSFTCNNEILPPNNQLNICIKAAPDMEIDYLENLYITQGDETMVVAEAESIQDTSISTMVNAPEHNGVFVATIVPTKFWRYSTDASISVTGVIWLKLVGSRRRYRVLRKDSLARPYYSNDERSTFELSVDLQREVIGVASDLQENNATYLTVNRITLFVGVLYALNFMVW